MDHKGFYRRLIYGPGSPGATEADKRQFKGSYRDPNTGEDYRLQLGDIAASRLGGFPRPGPNSYWTDPDTGITYHVADSSFFNNPVRPTPPGTWEEYYPPGEANYQTTDARGDLGPTAFQLPDGTWTGAPPDYTQGSGPTSGATSPDTIFSGSPDLWNAPTEPTMQLSDPYTGGVPSQSESLPNEGVNPSGIQYIDQPTNIYGQPLYDANGQPLNPQMQEPPPDASPSPSPSPFPTDTPSSLSLDPLVNSEGNYQIPNAPSTGPISTTSDYPGGIGSMNNYDPTFAYGVGDPNSPQSTDYGYLPTYDLSERPLDSWTQAAFAPSNVSGSGGPTQTGVGLLAGTLSNFAIPGSGLFIGPLARMITRGIQGANQRGEHNATPPSDGGSGSGGDPFGNMSMPQGYDPFGGLPQGFGESGRGPSPLIQGGPQSDLFSPGGSNQNPFGSDLGAPNFPFIDPSLNQGPQFNDSSIFTSGAAGDPFAGGAFATPAGGSIGGQLGGPTEGDVSLGQNDYFGRMGLQALINGGDTSLGFAGMPNANATFGAPVLPFSQWGGVGAGGATNMGAGLSGPNQRAMSNK